jgi:hypothetical protein
MEVMLISRLEEKFQLLLKKMQFLKEENARLLLSLEQHEQETARWKEKVREMEQSAAVVSIAGSASTDGEQDPERRKLLRSTINKYIREIDHCIAQLND